MMPKDKLLSQVYIKIGGINASEKLMTDVNEVVVDTSLHLPSMFTIRLNDSGLEWMDSKTFDLGKEVEISAKAIEASQKGKLMEGEITAIEPEFIKDQGAIIVIRGYDKSHRLYRGKKTRVFAQSTDSAIVSTIAQECGLWYDGDRTKVVYEHVFQDYQTDMEFIQDRARRNGYFAYVDENKLYFCQSPKTTGQVPTLEWGSGKLIDLQLRKSTAEQVGEANVHGWDIKAKKEILGKAKTPEGTPVIRGKSQDGGKAAKKAYELKTEQGVEHLNTLPVQDVKEANAIAQSSLNEKGNAFLQAEGTCLGDPKVQAGKKVEIKGIGKNFSGTYLVTRAIHHFGYDGYTTRFEISGYRANTLAQLLTNSNGSKGHGVVVGIVTNASDPENQARVKVKYPTISNDLESNWIRLVSPMAGPDRGFEFIPEVNDEVLVAFEYNDFNKPYILGALWNGKDKPPMTSKDAVNNKGVNKRVIKTRSGHTITLDDTENAAQMSIVSKSEHTITLDDKNGEEKISIIDKTKKNSIVIDSATNTLTIKADGDIIMNAEGKLQLNSKGDIVIDSKGKIDIKSTGDTAIDAKGNVKAKATANMDLEGAMMNVKGSATAKIEGGGMTEIKGTMVKIN
jgi:phage protein D/phage baseplate assembly protein gpV